MEPLIFIHEKTGSLYFYDEGFVFACPLMKDNTCDMNDAHIVSEWESIETKREVEKALYSSIQGGHRFHRGAGVQQIDNDGRKPE